MGESWLRWSLRKVASQDLLYLPRRLSYAIKKRVIDATFSRRTPAPLSSGPEVSAGRGADIREHRTASLQVPWHFLASDRERIVRMVPDHLKHADVSAAERLVRLEFRFRGQDPITMKTIDWACAPEGNRSWTWDLNRHFWFCTLGFAYAYTSDMRFLDAFRAATASWIEQHAHRFGRISWDTPFEVGARINAWIWAYHLFSSAEQWGSTERQQYLATLATLADYLYGVLEYHSPGNHILLEAKALVLCGEVFPHLKNAARWRRKGWRVLWRELRRQVGADGMHAERSTMYHRMIAGELADLWLFCRRNQHPATAVLNSVVSEMACFEDWVRAADGTLPLFGDAYLEDTYLRFSAPFLVHATQGRSVRAVHPLSAYDWWVIGAHVTPRFDNMNEHAHAPAARAFPQGGYFVCRSAWEPDADVLVWDCGPVGYHANRKHAHMDLLSFTLAPAGRQLLVDPGTDENAAVKEELRRTRVHNTVVVDGLDQCIPGRRGEIWSPTTPVLEIWAHAGNLTVMRGSHDGFGRSDRSLLHSRTIIVSHGRYWLILDELRAASEHTVEINHHFAPGHEVILDGTRCTVTTPHLAEDFTLVCAAARSHPDSGIGNEDVQLSAIDSFAELRCGIPERTRMVRARWSGRLPVLLATALAVGKRSGLGVSITFGDRGYQVAVCDGGLRDVVCVPVVPATPWKPPVEGSAPTNARLAVVRAEPGGDAVEVALVGDSKASGTSQDSPLCGVTRISIPHVR